MTYQDADNTRELLAGLNGRQLEAVRKTEGPVLILAGAGSGKTRVIVHRIAYMIAAKGISPRNILAITFTNKAADEMRSRVDALVEEGAPEVWVSTFHSLCVRILRRNIDVLGYDRYFSIYDADDQLRLMKDLCKRLEVDTKRYKERGILSAISRAKDELITPEEYELRADGDFETLVARVYPRYQETLKNSNALDFDDLIMKTVELFRESPDVLAFYRNRFRYICVDEYQDTNTAQFVLISLLAREHHNLCVVGDDDQSIYKFRGANISNILNFEKHFPDAAVIRLEQNYRSTQNILDCANTVIANNTQRKVKRLWTENEKGAKVRFRRFQNGFEEAEFVAREIRDKVLGGAAYRDFAVLYRTNAQSRLFEEKFISWNIPYRVVGGVNFYSRLEIKDMLAYLRTIDNAQDALSVRRIVNVPKRGIGTASVDRLEAYAEREEISLFEAMCHPDRAGLTERTAGKIRQFTEMILSLREKAETMTVENLLLTVMEKSGYRAELEAEHTEEADARIENLDEFLSKAASYDEAAGEEGTLSDFLAEVSLIADIDSTSDSDNVVLIMTLHSSKGLEFDHVYIAGMEDGVFPGYMSIDAGDAAELEEERRLAYVGITRAKKDLTLTAASERLLRGEVVENPVSRFVREIPREMIDMGYEGREAKRPALGSFGGRSDPVRQALHTKPSYGDLFTSPVTPKKTFAVKGAKLSYGVGDRVRHARFGEGTVREITEGGRDFEVTVQFDTVGVKKMFASFANMQKC
ncbi:MAG: DNA helicase PcrA [Lachnospiraceae bacterium]|nr:DNA helicase PcrA [Lachnospiraceae bacterium]